MFAGNDSEGMSAKRKKWVEIEKKWEIRTTTILRLPYAFIHKYHRKKQKQKKDPHTHLYNKP